MLVSIVYKNMVDLSCTKLKTNKSPFYAELFAKFGICALPLFHFLLDLLSNLQIAL
jgi:hypothetical protein